MPMRDRVSEALAEPLVRAVAVVVAALFVLFAYQFAFQAVDDILVPRGSVDDGGAPDSRVADADGLINTSAREEVNESRVEKLVLEYVNQARRSQGLVPLERDRALRAVARNHSEDMAAHGYLGHRDWLGRGPTERANAMGYRCVTPVHFGIGENVAKTYYRRGTRTNAAEYAFYGDERELARGVVAQWLRSDGHRAAMLADFFHSAGTGVTVTHGGTVYVTQAFC